MLPNEFVGVLRQAFLPGAIRVGKINDNTLEALCCLLVSRELAPIVSCDGKHTRKPVGIQQPDCVLGYLFCVLPMRQLFDDAV